MLSPSLTVTQRRGFSRLYYEAKLQRPAHVTRLGAALAVVDSAIILVRWGKAGATLGKDPCARLSSEPWGCYPLASP